MPDRAIRCRFRVPRSTHRDRGRWWTTHGLDVRCEARCVPAVEGIPCIALLEPRHPREPGRRAHSDCQMPGERPPPFTGEGWGGGKHERRRVIDARIRRRVIGAPIHRCMIDAPIPAFPRRRGKGHARERRSQRTRSERLPPQAGEGAMRACRVNALPRSRGRVGVGASTNDDV